MEEIIMDTKKLLNEMSKEELVNILDYRQIYKNINDQKKILFKYFYKR